MDGRGALRDPSCRRLEAGVMASSSSGDRSAQLDNGVTLAASDQKGADGDQTSGERDQASSDSDDAASDRDQAASDRDLVHGVESRAHDASREIRRLTAGEREQTATARLESARQRDTTAQARDDAALARDQTAAARDRLMVQRDAEHSSDDALALSGAEIFERAAEQRRLAAECRAHAAAYRAQAARDRAAAATDRERGARDRQRALADREALARALALSEIDALTGARARAPGLLDLDHEIDRSSRSGSALVIVYVDVVGLKRLNDSEGHDAGDRLLKRVVTLMIAHLRPYDLIIRLGGDEFLCAMSDMTHAEARQRLNAIASALSAGNGAGALRTGFAELTPGEGATELIARADAQLNAGRRGSDTRPQAPP